MTIAARRSWASPIITWFPSMNEGSGRPSIMCPIEIYMSSRRKPIEATSRRTIAGVSVSLRASSSAEAAVFAPLSEAP